MNDSLGADPVLPPSTMSTHRRSAQTIVGFVVALVIAVTAFAVGRQDRGHMRTLSGNAQVGDHLASVIVGGWAYGIVDSVAWVDSQGSLHESGWPTCLQPVGASVHIRFGVVPVTGPNHRSWREVVWVDCRG